MGQRRRKRLLKCDALTCGNEEPQECSNRGRSSGFDKLMPRRGNSQASIPRAQHQGQGSGDSREGQRLSREGQRLSREGQRQKLVALKVENKMLHQGFLQVQGLLTSRGLFERVAQLAFAEQKVAGHVKGSFNCTSALEQAVITPQSGSWSKLLKERIKKCAPAVRKSTDLQKKELHRLWADLSSAIHGHAWYGPDVKVVAALSKTGECVIARLAETLGLQLHEA